jgi:hypothetical protein
MYPCMTVKSYLVGPAAATGSRTTGPKFTRCACLCGGSSDRCGCAAAANPRPPMSRRKQLPTIHRLAFGPDFANSSRFHSAPFQRRPVNLFPSRASIALRSTVSKRRNQWPGFGVISVRFIMGKSPVLRPNSLATQPTRQRLPDQPRHGGTRPTIRASIHILDDKIREEKSKLRIACRRRGAYMSHVRIRSLRNVAKQQIKTNLRASAAVHNETSTFTDSIGAEARPLGRAESVLGGHASACCGA